VSECRVTVYCAAFTGVSLNLLTVALFIDRHAERIQFVPAGTENMYVFPSAGTLNMCFCIYSALNVHMAQYKRRDAGTIDKIAKFIAFTKI
jgi:hypothetical protein